MSARGVMTAEVRDKAFDLGFKNFDQNYLRLMPYLQYQLVNHRRIDPSVINNREREILSEWREEGRLEGGAGSDLHVTKEMWDAMHELLWIAYARGESE